jgi:tetratricopeptide (TPR) repeat protein
MTGRLTTSTEAESKLWKQLMRAWNGGLPACHSELAIEYTKKYPDNVAGWIALADGFVHFARYEDARKALRKAQKLVTAKRLPDIYVQWGHFENERNDLKKAEYWYRRAVKLKTTTRTLIFLGAVLAKRGRFSEAKDCHRQAVILATDPPDEAYYNLGLIFRAERKYEKALECFERAIRIDRKYVHAKTARKDVKAALKLKSLTQ